MTIMADNRMMAQMSMTDGFIAALDQSGGSPQPNTGDKHASRGRWAGAVGCYYGGLLARAGHEVTFIGRRTHVDAINAHGLLLDTQGFKKYLPARSATDASSLASPDLVLFCVTSADTEEAGR